MLGNDMLKDRKLPTTDELIIASESCNFCDVEVSSQSKSACSPRETIEHLAHPPCPLSLTLSYRIAVRLNLSQESQPLCFVAGKSGNLVGLPIIIQFNTPRDPTEGTALARDCGFSKISFRPALISRKVFRITVKVGENLRNDCSAIRKVSN